jgi:hypothetical protein
MTYNSLYYLRKYNIKIEMKLSFLKFRNDLTPSFVIDLVFVVVCVALIGDLIVQIIAIQF